jgi:hypothetical protein
MEQSQNIMAHPKFFASLLLLAIFSIPNLTFAQQVPKIEWQRCLGGSTEEDRGGDALQSIVQTSDGNYVICGYTLATDGDVSGVHDISNGDMWVVKLSSSGSIIWQKCIGGSNPDAAKSIIQTLDKGYAIVGYTASNNGDVLGWHNGIDSSFPPFFTVHDDAWVVKLDSSGNIQWQKCLGGSGEDQATSILQTADGSYIVTGTTSSTDGDISGKHGSYDVFVIKLTSSGNIQWQKCFGGQGYDHANSIIQTSDGGYIAAGFTDSPDEGFFNHGGGDVYVVKLDSIGNKLWEKCYGGSIAETAFSIVQTPDNGYAFVGKTQSSDGQVNGFKGGYTDAWLVRLNPIGDILWQKSLGGSSSDVMTMIVQPSEGGFLIAGGTGSNDGDVTDFHAIPAWSKGLAWIVRLNSSGIIVWQKCLGGSGQDNANEVIQTSDGGYIMSGTTSSVDGDVSGVHFGPNGTPLQDIWVVKLSPAKDDVKDINISQDPIRAYPNPASNQMQLNFSTLIAPERIEFFNAMGSRIFPEYKLEDNYAMIKVQNLFSGIYTARVQSNNYSNSVMFVVQH